jgi:hypothetical protein
MSFKTSRRSWTHKNSTGALEILSVEYTLFFKNGQIVDIRNEFHYSVEQGSDCWNYFQRKFQNGLI